MWVVIHTGLFLQNLLFRNQILYEKAHNPKTKKPPPPPTKKNIIELSNRDLGFYSFQSNISTQHKFIWKIKPSFFEIVNYLGRGNKRNKRFMDPSFSWGRRKWSVCRSYIFRHFAETPQPPSVADCKIRKLLPSWGNNRLPQCFSAQPAAASESGNYSSRITFFSYSLFLWARSPPTASMYFLCKTVEEVTF